LRSALLIFTQKYIEMKSKYIDHETWLDLSDAAQYIGVHFTTLRRWADAGEISFIRTPGGRRRFTINALDQFLHRLAVTAPALMPSDDTAFQPLQDRAIDHARQSVRSLPVANSWLNRLNDNQRDQMRGTGQRLMVLLIQYSSRVEGGEAFLDEARRIGCDYGLVCSQAGLSLPETVQVFLFFRRSILDSMHKTEHLAGENDLESQRLYDRTTDFFDELLLALISSFPVQISSQVTK
jgi:excisionase family DNA binding protein